jgi:N-acetylmuramoyl-L-alanine amidase
VFVSCHRNAYGDPAANGGEALYGKTASAASIRLAETVNASMNKAAGFRNRGAKRQGATVLQRTKMPAVTVEAGFVTSTVDNSRFDNNFSAIIKGIADALEAVFGKGNATPTAPGTKPDDPLEYVTTGNAVLWRNVGAPPDGTKVILDAHPTQDEPGGVYARVKDESGDAYLVAWANIRKA